MGHLSRSCLRGKPFQITPSKMTVNVLQGDVECVNLYFCITICSEINYFQRAPSSHVLCLMFSDTVKGLHQSFPSGLVSLDKAGRCNDENHCSTLATAITVTNITAVERTNPAKPGVYKHHCSREN